MARPGPRPEPTELKLARGVRPDRINPAEPLPPAGELPTSPEWLNDEAAGEWRRLAPLLHAAGILTDLDIDTLATYCDAAIHLRRASKALELSGPVIRGRRDHLVVSPALRAYRDLAQLQRALAQELGLTPSARSTIRIRHEVELAPVLDLGQARGRREDRKPPRSTTKEE